MGLLAETDTGNALAGWACFLVFASILGLIHFLPAILAASRNHPNFAPILMLNLFLGWTLIGWVVALCWALMAEDNGRGPRCSSASGPLERPYGYGQSQPLYDDPTATRPQDDGFEEIIQTEIESRPKRPGLGPLR